jgi:2-phosphosulfolactate phosphatase
MEPPLPGYPQRNVVTGDRRAAVSCDVLDSSTVTIFADPGAMPPVLDGVVVVIDVIRAFTTAAVLLAGGASEIVCVRDVREAEAAAATMCDTPLLIGEHRDPPFPPVDLPNSPTAAAGKEVTGRTVVFFTVNGTRVLAQVPPSLVILAAAAVNVSATAAWILAKHPNSPVYLLVSDPSGPEDLACAHHLAVLLTGGEPDSAQTEIAVLRASAVHERTWGANVLEAAWNAFVVDVEVCAKVDAVPVALVCAWNSAGLLVMRAETAL